MSRKALFEAAWKRPLTEIADELGITSTGLKKICDRHDIPTPGRGYWAQVRAGKSFPRPALRPVKDPRLEEVGILGARALSPAVAAAVQASRAWVAEGRKTPSKLPLAAAPPPPGATPPETVEAKTASLAHKDLAATRRALSRARPDDDGFVSVSGAGIVPIKAGLASHPSAITFLTALVAEAEARGWSLQATPNRVHLMIAGEPVAFRLEEQPTKIPHLPTPKEVALKKDRDRWGGDSQTWRTWDLSPSGRLALIIEENDYSGLRRTYSQRKGHSFEESLDAILMGLAAHAALKVERRREAEVRAKAAAEAEARRQRLEAFKHRETRRMAFTQAVDDALAERAKLRTVLDHLKGDADAAVHGPTGMDAWLRRRLQALDARLSLSALKISARHAEIGFEEPPTGKVGSRW
ncbi:MAG: hypothetical protein Q8N10_04565 [Phenylobacterium sp.]|uniref:hypothetical protein n=1 Tax=Phenylobacterium sp. TaxID=1871053 RepID=UPI0027282D79|nr:hypothetical protein [Phenylobacterium sp.]MDO8914003.1 hypothetical protein [Phenylobacterium sp.]MDP3099757.1 hypothetical protein [Phenylobacterium sp.]